MVLTTFAVVYRNKESVSIRIRWPIFMQHHRIRAQRSYKQPVVRDAKTAGTPVPLNRLQ